MSGGINMMNKLKHIALIITLLITAGFLFHCSGPTETVASNAITNTTYNGLTITGPYSFQNLDVFLAHGEDKIKAGQIITLEEALKKKVAVVHETSQVSELSVENTSEDTTIYIQSGDIVKGGKQDRVMRYDVMVPPKSKEMRVASYCVEANRWQKRENEDSTKFNSSRKMLVSKKAKLAAKHRGSQQEMWSQVAVAQEKLSSNLGASVKDNRSASSLQLSLENKNLKKEATQYVKQLEKNMKDAGAGNTLGYIFAVNGEINSADIYAGHALFKKLKGKLLESYAAEAISEKEKNNIPNAPKTKTITASDVTQWLKEAEKGNKTKKAINDALDLEVRETEENVAFETVDKSRKDGKTRWVHKNYIKKK